MMLSAVGNEAEVCVCATGVYPEACQLPSSQHTHSHTLRLDAHETLQLCTLTVYPQIHTHTHTMEPSVLIIEYKSSTNNMQRESLPMKLVHLNYCFKTKNINLIHDIDVVTNKTN